MVFGLTNMMGGAAAAADPYFDSVVFLSDFDGIDQSTVFKDLSNSNHTVTANGDAQIDSGNTQFGSGALLLDGSGDFLTVPYNSDFDLVGDFTIEAWVYVTGGSSFRPIWDCIYWNGSQVQHGFGVNSSGALYFYFYNGANNFHYSTSNISISTWTHVALVRSGTNITFYIDGVPSGTFTTSQSFTYSASRRIGFSRTNNGNRYFQGHIDELRVTNGVARDPSQYDFQTPFLTR